VTGSSRCGGNPGRGPTPARAKVCKAKPTSFSSKVLPITKAVLNLLTEARRSIKGEIMELIEKISKQGWTERNASEFELRYGESIRWRIVIYMEKLGFVQQKLNPRFVDRLSDRRLELFQDTYSDLWVRLLNGLIKRYVEGKRRNLIHSEFLQYLSGVIKNILLDNARALDLLPEETPYEIILSICEAKRDRKARIAWAKYCFGERVKEEILNRCPKDAFPKVYKEIHHVVDYFFEVFVIAHEDLVRKAKRHTLATLVQALLERDLEKAVAYIGQIAPYAGHELVHTPEEIEDEETFLSALREGIARLA
jgi:hypothetical protein